MADSTLVDARPVLQRDTKAQTAEQERQRVLQDAAGSSCETQSGLDHKSAQEEGEDSPAQSPVLAWTKDAVTRLVERDTKYRCDNGQYQSGWVRCLMN